QGDFPGARRKRRAHLCSRRSHRGLWYRDEGHGTAQRRGLPQGRTGHGGGAGPVKLPEMKTGLTISALAHAALLAWGLISFAGRRWEAAPNEGMPVDIISDKQFSEWAKGVKTGAKNKPPAPLVEKVGETKPVEDPTAKVTEKKEIKVAKEAEPPPPAPEPKP